MMPLLLLLSIWRTMPRRLAPKRAQNTFEYVLIIGTITVGMILAVATPVGTFIIGAVRHGACAVISSLPNTSVTC